MLHFRHDISQDIYLYSRAKSSIRAPRGPSRVGSQRYLILFSLCRATRIRFTWTRVRRFLSNVTCHGGAKQVRKNANESLRLTSRRRFYSVFLSLTAAFFPPLDAIVYTSCTQRGAVFFSFSASDSRVPEERNKGASKKTFPRASVICKRHASLAVRLPPLVENRRIGELAFASPSPFLPPSLSSILFFLRFR